MIVFINNIYHSVFNVFGDIAEFKTRFCINNGLDEVEVTIYNDLSVEQRESVDEMLLQANTKLKYVAGSAIVSQTVEISNGDGGFNSIEEVVLTVALDPAS